MICHDCQAAIDIYRRCDQDCIPRCLPCHAKTPCGRGEHWQGCETEIYEVQEMAS